ncbi:MAG TPA: hypothetical protein VH419_04700 [Nocardioidaceae bacterium]
MTSNVAAVLAVAAVVLVVVLGWLVLRLRGQLRELQTTIASLDRRQAELVDRLDESAREQHDTWQAVELALLGQESASRTDGVATGPTGSTGSTGSNGSNGSTGSTGSTGGPPDEITVITDIDNRDRDRSADLSTARVASVTLGGPLIKVAAFSHGVRHALDEEQRLRIRYAVRKELRHQRKMRRRRRTERAPSKGRATVDERGATR